MRRGKPLIAGCVLACSAAWAGDIRSAAALEKALAEESRRYDVQGATAVLSEVRVLFGRAPSPALADLHVRASLEVAELLRIEFEETPEAEREARRVLGQRIDATAGEGLERVDGLPESSERWRRRADLIATLIRSDFRAKKYESEFKAAVARALELDEANAAAWVSAAKPFLFAAPEHGGDVREALRLLTKAVDLDPRLESARLLRAEASVKLGDEPAAVADWRAVLGRNPDCAPARRRLDTRAGPG